MLNFQSKSFLQSAPIKIFFAGFESDTLKLQHHGWSLAIEDEFDHPMAIHRMRFILKHPMLDLIAMTDIREVEFQDFIRSAYNFDDRILFNIFVMAKNAVIRCAPSINIMNVRQIDATPNIIDMETQNLNELSIFQTLVKPDNALIVEPEQISALLEKIVAVQSPKQAEIREKMRKADARDNFKQTLHAQILSIAA